MRFEHKTSASRAQQNQTNALIQAARRIRRALPRPRGRLRFGLRNLAEIKDEPIRWSAEQLKIREIGKRLFAEGGISRMREAWEPIFIEDPRVAKQVEIAWEGIGGWYR